MPAENLLKFAEELKQKREEKGYSLEQIHNRTRINIKYLEAIEAGNFDIMPDVYMIAFIKEFASSIDLDKEETARKYKMLKSGIKEEDPDISDEDEAADEKTPPKAYESPAHLQEERTPSASNINIDNKTLYIGGGVILTALLVLLYFLVLAPGKTEIVTEKPFDDVIKEQNERYKEDEPTADNTSENKKFENPSAVAGAFNVNITTTDTSWIRANIDNRDTVEFILYPGNNKRIDAANRIDFIVGNSGGVEFFLNNSRLNFQGRKGAVRTLYIDKEGIHYNTPGNNNE